MPRIAAALLLPALVAAAPAASPRAAIEAGLADSVAGWNAGNLDRYMAVYASDATFVAPDGLIQGKAAIAQRFRGSFTGSGNSRGRLEVRVLAIRKISEVHQLVFAQFALTPGPGAKIQQGWTTLLFERRKEGWRVISDHSS
jgi:uncharacterized protein (TIGR02246 family)